MAQFLAAFASSGAPVGGAAASGGAAGAIAGASGASATSILSGAVNVLGMATGFSAAQHEAANLKFKAKMDDLNAKAEEIKGRTDANEIRGRLIRALAQQNAAAGAAGVTGGTIDNARTQAISKANSELSVARSDSAIRRDNLLISAEQGRADAKMVDRASKVKLIVDIGKMIATAGA